MLSGLRSQKISYILHVKLDVLKNIYMLLYNVRKMKVVDMLVLLYFVYMERQRARCLYKNDILRLCNSNRLFKNSIKIN